MINTIIYELTTSKYNRVRDRIEVSDLFEKYGEDVGSVVAQRAADKRLPARDRRHWQRMRRAVRYFSTDGKGSDEASSG